jgi:hypothetical protein
VGDFEDEDVLGWGVEAEAAVGFGDLGYVLVRYMEGVASLLACLTRVILGSGENVRWWRD